MGSYEDVNLDVIEEPLSVIEQNLSFSVSVQSGFEEQACLEAACRVFESNVELASAPDGFLGSSEVDDTFRVSSVEATEEGMKVLYVNKDDLVGEGENVGDLMLEKVPGNECGISGDCLDEILCLGDVCSLENGGLCLEKEGSQGEGDYEKPLESSPLTDIRRNCVQMDEIDDKCVSSSSAERVTEVKTDQSGVLDGAETDIHSLKASSQGCEMPSDLILKTGLPNNHTQQNEQEDTKSVGGLSSEVMYGKRASSAETETIFCNPILPSGDLVSNGDWHSDQKDEKKVSDLSAETVTEILEPNNDVDTCTQASTSWGCQSDLENLHKAESPSICAKQNEQSGVLEGVETDIHNLISSSQGCEMPSDLVPKTGLPDNHTQQNEQEDTKSVGGLSLEVMDGKRDSSAETETAFCKPVLPSGDLVSNGDWHSDQKVEKTVSDLSEETFTEILETKNDVDTCTQASTSWGCQSDSENLHKAESLSICAKQNEQKDGEGVDGPCVERVSNVVQDKGDIITVVSVEFDTHTLPLEENSCKSEEGDTKIVHNCNFEKSVSPQSCQPFGIVNHSTSKDTPDQDAIGSINSSSVVESSGHTDNEGKDNVRVGCFSETKCPEVVSSSSRRNNQRSKSRQKTHRKRAAKKCKNAANVPHPHESIGIVLKVGRRKRSCLSKPARSSMWGLLGHITQFLEQGNMLDGVNQFHNQGLGKARRGQGSGKQKKIRGSGNSGGSRGNRCASTGLIRLKVKVGKVAGESCLSTMVPEVVNTLASADATTSDDQTEMHSGTGLELSKLANGVEAKSREDETGLHLQCFSKLPEKAKTLPDGFIMDGQLATSGSENTNILDKTAGDADNYLEVPSHVVVEALGGEIDSKCTNPGTSPDSEVINLIPDVQVAARHQADLHDAVLTTSKDVAARRRRTSSKRGKKDRLPRSRNSVLEDGSQGPVSMNEAKPSKKHGCRQDISNGSKASKSVSKRGNVQRQREKQRKSVNNCKVKDKDACNQIVCKVESQPESGSQKVDGIGKANTGDDTAVTNKSDLEMVRGGLEEQLLPPRKAWVLCDDCHKWRRIPAVLADFIEKTNCTWTCKDNLDKAFAACSIAQEKSNAEINVELDISDASGEEDACGARLNLKGLDCRRSIGYQDSTFKCISTNEFLHRKRRSQTIDEIMVCSCKPPSKGQLGCGEGCLNRMLSIECVQGACPCGDLCSNQQFQKQKYANLEWFRCGKKGYGLKLLEDISEGKFLIEYVGEVLNMQAYEARQKEYALKGHRHFYFMTLNGSEVIDACAKGNLGRFINHSCDPNCRTEKWIVNGEICIGLFALRNIKKGEELTFDYNYVRVFGAAAKKCYCGASQCRGYIGGDLLNTEVIVQGDSDEEFPEPVMVPEGGKGRNGLDYMMPRAIPSDSAEIKAAKGILKDRNGLDEATAVVEQLKSTIEKEEPMNQSANSQLLSSLELEDSKGNSPSFVQPVELSHQTEDVTCKHLPAVLQETSIEEETVNKSSFNGDRLEIISPTMLSKSLGHGVDANRKSKFETVEDKRVSVKSHSLMKGSRSSSSVKKEKVRSSPLNTNQVQVTPNKSQVLSIKSKKLLEGSSNGRSEAVEEKLNELLDTDGGISKRKDAPKGYLKLLLLTAASGDSGNGEAIQSNRDLSMILDALLKTKSRAVLIDIINKNGLRMLHNIMKQYRRDFKKIPILRKLLKVLEYLAMREILTPEHINGGPPCPGMESFRASILSFTEHDDKQVHQIARNFRDKWIPRPVRKLSYLDRDDGRMESRRGSNCNRSSAQTGYWHDQHVRPTEAIDCVKQAMVATTSGDTGLQEGCFSPSVGSCPAKETKPRKRKSRWDQPAETNPDSRSSERKEQKIESTLLQQCESRPSQGGVEVAVDHIDSVSRKNRNCPGCVQNQCQHDEATRADNERQNIPEDVPPGFSSPRALGTLNASSTVIDLHQQNVCHTKCPDDAIIGQPQEKFISRLPVSYGIPLSIVQHYGTPQEESVECWVIAPGMPFYPFPPLPQFPRDHKDHAPLHSLNPLTINQPAEEERRDSNCPASYADDTTPCANSQQTFKRARDSSYDLGRRYFRQQKWNNTKLGPPWIRKRNGWEHMGDNSRGETCSIGIENVENEPKNSYLSEDVGCRVEKAGNFFYQHSQHQDHH